MRPSVQVLMNQEAFAMPISLTPENTLPTDGLPATLIGRAWIPGTLAGPSPIVLRADGVFDLSAHFATISELLEQDSPLDAVRQAEGRFVTRLDALLANTGPNPDPDQPYLLAPLDLQVIKAAGVTFAASMIERVIEEKAGGDAAAAESVRAMVRKFRKKAPKSCANTSKYSSSFNAVPMGSLSLIRPEKIKRPPSSAQQIRVTSFIGP